ncbi:MAG: hypothetical protein AAGA54_10340 [Myxococcota bacterium]
MTARDRSPLPVIPRRTSDGRSVPRLVGARDHTMSLIAAVLEDEARKDAPTRAKRRAAARDRAGFLSAVGLGCALAGCVLGLGAALLQTPELDALEATARAGGVEALSTIVERDPASEREAALVAFARAQQAAWGDAGAPVRPRATEGAGAPLHREADVLLAAMRGEPTEDAQARMQAWAQGIGAGRGAQDVAQLDAAIQALAQTPLRPVGASRQLASLAFARGDVRRALRTLDALATPASAADLAWTEAMLHDAVPPPDEHLQRGRAALREADLAIRAGDAEAARLALSQARASMLPWDAMAIGRALELSFVAGDEAGLRRWTTLARYGADVRGLVAAYADATAGRWSAAERRLQHADSDAPAVAYVLAWAAAERGAWPEAVRHVGTARRAMPGRRSLDALAARAAAHFIEPGGAHRRLVALSEEASWVPGLWTALAEVGTLVGRPQREVLAQYERALEHEHRPALAAAALAERSNADEAIHLWTMASALAPDVATYRAGLGVAHARQGRVAQAWRELSTAAEQGALDQRGWTELLALAVGSNPEPDAWARWRTAAEAAGVDPQLRAAADLRLQHAAGRDVLDDAKAMTRQHPELRAGWEVTVLALGDAKRPTAVRRWADRARARLGRADQGWITLAEADALAVAGERREAAQLAFKGWAALGDGVRPSAALLRAGAAALGHWMALENTSGARAIARTLTERMPHSPDAWLLRAEVQHAAAESGAACASLRRAQQLDPDAHAPALQACDADPA